MARRHNNEGFGIALIAMSMILFVLFLMLIPTIPFQISVVEQSLLYLFAFIILIAGLALMLK